MAESEYTTSSTYDAERPSYHMLICLVEVWNPKGKMPQELMMPEGKPDFMIAEAQSIEIRESYRNVVSTAALIFPRGTIIKKTLEADPTEYASAVTASINSQGAIIENRTNSSVATVDNFEVGSRIRIRLGYTTDPAVYNLTKVSAGHPSIFTSDDKYNEYIGYLTTMFEGYITRCSIDQPIMIECEDLAHLLKCVSCKKITTTNKSTVKQLLYSVKDGGVHGLLAKTGLKLHPDTEEITVGKCSITSDFTVYDVLNQWHKWKIYAYLAWDNDGNPCIAVRNTYFSGGKGSLVDNARTVNEAIDFQYQVADNNLEMQDTDKKSLAIHACSKDADEKKMTTLTLMSNPEWKEGDSEQERWRVHNETKISKRAMKKHHIRMITEGSSKINLSEYTVVEYMSRKIGLTHDQLLKEAIAFYEAYNMNGVEGSLVLFGDLKIRTTDIVELKDLRFPMKNGKYLVEEVRTTFGTRGFRQSIRLPYCLKRDSQNSDNNGSGE